MIFTIHFGGKIPLFLGWHPYRYKIRSTEESTSQPVDRHLLNHLLILAPSCLSENELKWCFMMFPRKSCYLIYIIIYKHIRMYIMHLHMQMIWFIIWYDMIWYDMIWYDMIWYDMIWYEMMWDDMILYKIYIISKISTCFHIRIPSQKSWWVFPKTYKTPWLDHIMLCISFRNAMKKLFILRIFCWSIKQEHHIIPVTCGWDDSQPPGLSPCSGLSDSSLGFMQILHANFQVSKKIAVICTLEN